MEGRDILFIIIVFGSIFFTSFSTSYAESLQGSTISSGGTNSTSSGFSLISAVERIAGYVTSTGFQLFAGFLPTTQGGNAIPTNLFSGVTGTVGSDGTVTISLTSESSGSVDFTDLYAVSTVGGEDQITTDRDFSFTDGGIGASTLIPGGTTITADTADWNGVFRVPLSISTLTSGGAGGVTTLAISIGSDTIDFTLNHPIRITFEGLAGNLAAVIARNSVVTEITTICNGVDFATVDAQLGPDESCKTSANGDLIVWTQRLSTFISFVPKTGAGYIDIEGPSFIQNFNEGESPLVIGSTVFPKLGFYNERTETATVNIGTQVPFKLLMSENSGPQNVQHVALYMNLYGSAGTESHKSNTWIVFDKNRDIEIHDPQGFIDDAYASTATKGNKFETLFYITFAKPMEKSNLIMVAWDNDRNGITATVLDAFEVIDPQAETKKQQKEAIVAETLQEVQEKEAIVAETLQEVKEKELALVAAMVKYGTASTEAKVAQEILDKAESKAKVAQDALDKAKSDAKVAQEQLDVVKEEAKVAQEQPVDMTKEKTAVQTQDPQAKATIQQKEVVLAEALQEVQQKEVAVTEILQKVQQKEVAVAVAIAKYGTASTEAKVAQEQLDVVKEEAKVAQEQLDVVKEEAKVAQEQLDVVKKGTTLPTPEPGVDVVPEPGVDVASPAQKETIQKWAGFHVASASDSDLLSALNIKTEADSAPHLPKWTKNTLAKWTLDEKISMREFVNVIKYFAAK